MTYIFYYKFSYTNYLLDIFKDDCSIRLVPIEYESNLLNKIDLILLRFHHSFFAPISLNKGIINILSQVSEQDSVIFFDYLKLSNVKYILRRIKSNNIHFWFWNTVNKYTKYILTLRNPHTKFHTFDNKDASKYDMVFHEQIYREPNENLIIKPTFEQVDFFFIGQNKNRLRSLQKLNAKLTAWGYTTNFIVVDSNLKPGIYDGIKVQTKEIDYQEVLNMIMSTKVLVELNKTNQTGLTLRCLEGVFFNKKVITNNRSITSNPIYSANNILLIDENLTVDSLSRFLKLNIEPYTTEIRQKHNIQNWLKNIINSNQTKSKE